METNHSVDVEWMAPSLDQEKRYHKGTSWGQEGKHKNLMDNFHKPKLSTIEPFPIVIQNSSSNLAGTFPGGPAVKNPPCNAGNMGSIPGRGTKIPHAVEQTKPKHHNYWIGTPQLEFTSLNERATTETKCK